MSKQGRKEELFLRPEILLQIENTYQDRIQVELAQAQLGMKSYRALRHLGERLLDENVEINTAMLQLELAVWAWMPTIIKVRPALLFSDNVHIVRKLQTREAADQFLNEDGPALPLHYSWVGMSKALHFIHPSVFPIWDSRVARCFTQLGLNGRELHVQNINSKQTYLSYCHAVDEILNIKDCLLVEKIIPDLQKTIRDEYQYEITPIRALELILYWYGERPV